MGRGLEFLLRKEKGKKVPAILLGMLGLAMLIAFVFNIGRIPTVVRELSVYMGYRFIFRALLVGTVVALCSALLGVILVLRHYSMIGDGLSHVGFGAISIAASLRYVTVETLPGWFSVGISEFFVGISHAVAERPLFFALTIVTVAAVLLLRMNKRSGMGGDEAIALLSTASLAVGVLVTSLTSGMNVDLMSYMFGSILALSESDVVVTLVLSAMILVVFVLFRNRLFAVTFDEVFADATGIRVRIYDTLIAVMTAITIVIGMRMMGTMLISSLIVFPALTAMRVFSNFRNVLIASSVLSVVCFIIGMLVSCLFSIPAGAAIIMVDLFFFLVFVLIGRIKD